MANAEKEVGLPDEEQPLYLDEEDGLIKCKWCGKNFSGSQQMRCINQHVRKSATHRQARKKYLSKDNIDQNASGINGELCNIHACLHCVCTYVDISDQTDHNYIQIYMHPKPSGLTYVYYVIYINL